MSLGYFSSIDDLVMISYVDFSVKLDLHVGY
jgi:hypothetical protein